jgi:ABC-type multidrug transport system ATPase subunit
MSVHVEHGVVRRGRRTVLQPGAFSLPATGTVGVIGVNGSGKTTLFMGLADVLPAGAGAVSIRAPWQSPRTAFMPQEAALPLWLTPARTARLYGMELAALDAALPGLRLAELRDRTVGQLSGGQRQVLSLALALGRRADLTILDEPLAHLDLPRRHEALRAIAAHETGLTLVSAQSTADVVDCCDAYIVLRDGRYVFCGTVEELLGEEWRTDPARRERLEARLLELLGFTAVP